MLLVGVGASPVAARQATPGQASANVLVIPGFNAPHYPGTFGVPPFPSGSPALAGYRLSGLAGAPVTPAALRGYDTIVLYGLRWSTLSVAAQSAINSFALTGKVVIWDADSTGSQSYGSFLLPFSTTASGEVEHTNNGSIVSFPGGSNPLASPDPASPLYLDPAALTASTHLIEDMSVLNAGAGGWAPGLIAANGLIPNGGWVLAWGYGSIQDHTGMVIYSGMDADAFTDAVSPNYAVKELAIELAAPFQRTAASCAPTCSPPPVPPTGGGGGSAGSGLGGAGLPTFSACSFQPRPPASWVRGRVALMLKTGVATGVTGKVVTPRGKLLGTGVSTARGRLRLVVDTRRLPSNRASTLLAFVYVNGTKACSLSSRLRVDNIPPRFVRVAFQRQLADDRLSVRTSEGARLAIVAHDRTLRIVRLRAEQTTAISLPAGTYGASLILTDRAGNSAVRRVAVR